MSIEPPVERVTLNGIPLATLTLEQASAWIFERIRHSGPLSIITTVNLQFLRIARTNPAFAELLQQHAALNLVDGWPVAWLLRRRGVAHAVTASGSDLTRRLLMSEAARDTGIYLLGDAPATIQAVYHRGKAEGWEAAMRGAESPTPDAVDNNQKSQEIVKRINASGARILLVAFGAPRQEQWLKRWSHSLTVQVGIGIGGSLKFIAWPERRAPLWMRRSGLEWIHRLSLEPARLIPRYTQDALELIRLVTAQRRPLKFTHRSTQP